jgi:hypothetical protein
MRRGDSGISGRPSESGDLLSGIAREAAGAERFEKVG